MLTIFLPTGVAVTQVFSRGAGAFNTFVNPIAIEAIEWKLYIVYVVWLAIETAIIYVLYPETKGPALEELSRLFEDNDPLSHGKMDLQSSEKDNKVAQVEDRLGN